MDNEMKILSPTAPSSPWSTVDYVNKTSRLIWPLVFVVSLCCNASAQITSTVALLNSNGKTDSADDTQVKIATDGLGNWVAVWASGENITGTSGTDADIFFARSIDNGATWSDPALLNTNGTSDIGGDDKPAIAADGAGNWVAVWRSQEDLGGIAGNDPDIFVARSTDGINWSAPSLLSTVGAPISGSNDNADISTDGAGNWIAVWESTTNIGGTADGDQDIVFARSTDDGITWSPMAVLNSNGTTDGGGDNRPSVSVGQFGKWIAVWTGGNPNGPPGINGGVNVAESTDGGATWSTMTLLNTVVPRSDGIPKIAGDENGNWVVVWESAANLGGNIGTDYDIVHSRSSDNGLTWSAPAPLTLAFIFDSRGDRNPSISTDGEGNWITVWESTENLGGVAGPDTDIFFSISKNNGSTWTSSAFFHNNATIDYGHDELPYTATDGAGHWVGVWVSKEILGGPAGTDRDIFVTHFDVPFVYSLSVPFYLDNASNFNGGGVPADGVASFVGVKNTNNSPITLSVTYTDTAGTDHTPANNIYNLGPNAMVSWRPFADDPVEGNDSGRLVPNTSDGPPWGSILIRADGEITGRLILSDGVQDSSAMMLLPDGGGSTKLSVPFYLDNASNFSGGSVPSDGTASFVGVKNMNDVPVTLTITYTDDKGIDHTPVNNTYVLAANSMVSWRPFADDPVEGDDSGRLVPNTSDGPPWGSVLIESTRTITGRLISSDGIQDSTAMMVLPRGGESSKLSVPFYLDNASNFSGGSVPSDGTASFVGVKNMSDVPVTLTITYTDTSGIDHTPEDNTYELAANSMVSWRPFADDPAEGDASGRLVPNTSDGPAWGSVLIEADGPITGRLITLDGTLNSTALLLLPEGGGSSTLSVPFYLDNASNFSGGSVPSDGTASFVGIKNMSDVPVTLTITYTDTSGLDHTPANNTYVLAANSMVSWRPFADDPAEGDDSGRLVPNTSDGPAWGSVLIEADGPITGRLVALDGTQNSTGLMLLPGE